MAKKKETQEQSVQPEIEQPEVEQAEEKKPKLQRIIFVGEGEPKKNVRIGMLRLELPDADEQRKGFETEHARLIKTNLSGYKYFNPLAAHQSSE